MSVLQWIQHWYASHCDGDWEHDYGIRIYNVDNPGWSVVVDLIGTNLECQYDQEWQLFEKSETNWYGYAIKDNRFKASGDPSKLEFLLEQFKELVEAAEAEEQEA